MTSLSGRPRNIGCRRSRSLSIFLLAISSLALAPSTRAQAAQDLGRQHIEWFQARAANALVDQLSDTSQRSRAGVADWVRKWQKELLLALVMFVILATAAAFVIGGQIRARRRARAWVAAAEALGLGPVEEQGAHWRASGTYRETAVTVGVTAYRHRGARSTNVTYDPWVRVSFPATLGLGLEVHPSVGSLWRQLAAPFDTQRLQTGNSEFDEMFTVRATDEEGARCLLEPPDEGGRRIADLLAGHPDRDRIRIDDETVTIRTRGLTGEGAVRSALDSAVALARVLWEARRALPR